MKQSPDTSFSASLDFDKLFPTVPMDTGGLAGDGLAVLDTLMTEKLAPISADENIRSPPRPKKRNSLKGKKAVEEVPPGLTKPRRPLTAYNLFFRAERAKLIGTEPSTDRRDQTRKKRLHRKTHGKIGFMELAKYIGKKWKNLDADSRAVYVAQAAEDLKRYREDMEKYRQAVHEMGVKDRANQEQMTSDIQKSTILAPQQRSLINGPEQMKESGCSMTGKSMSSISAARHYYALNKALEISQSDAQPTQHRDTLSRALEICENETPNGGGEYMPCASGGSLRDLENDLRHTLDDEVISFLSNLR